MITNKLYMNSVNIHILQAVSDHGREQYSHSLPETAENHHHHHHHHHENLQGAAYRGSAAPYNTMLISYSRKD